MKIGNNTLVIVAAGNSTRMGQLPKAASLINGVPNLYNLVRGCKPYFDKIYVASNEQNKELYEEILKDFDDISIVIPIESGRGCGDAILTILEDIRFNLNDDCVFCWGDTFFTKFEIFSELINFKSEAPLIIPSRYEQNPYAWFDICELDLNKNNHISKTIKKVNFKKRGDSSFKNLELHDQSLFKLNAQDMRMYLGEIKKVTWNGDRYLNNEMIFLDCVSYLYNCNNPAIAYKTEYDSFSYNTVQELDNINAILKNK